MAELTGNRLKDALLNPNTFCVTWELIPGRGTFEVTQQEVIED